MRARFIIGHQIGRRAMAEIAALPRDTGATETQSRPQLIAGAGAVIILISAAAALLPLGDGIARSAVVGTMMVTAGLVEIIAGGLRSRNRPVAILPGVLTVFAGALLAVHPLHRFVPSVWVVIAWLGARGTVLGVATTVTHGSVRVWTMLAAGTDLTLGAVLLLGLSASTLTLTLFGTTPEIIRSFAWVVALSFVATGMLLMEVAACERK
jgi:uncharacterized membrane protein HdeD (DUF308 family)